MAVMLPEHFADSTVSVAEKRVFESLKRAPGTGDWIVFHALGLARRGRKPYGEIDFVVVVPGTGVVCLEVKGGRVACHNGCWSTIDKNGNVHEMRRSPFLQAREGMFSLRDSVLRRAPAGFPSALLFGCAVVFPDIDFPVQSPEWESWQVIDRAAITGGLRSAILRACSALQGLNPGAAHDEPRGVSLRTLRQLLRPDFEIVVTKRAQIEETEAELVRMTEEQFEVLDLMAINDRCLFEGAAGTGKTVLALENARRFAAQGKKVLFICFNRLLGDWLERQVRLFPGADLIVCGTFYSILRSTILGSSIAEEFRAHEATEEKAKLFDSIFPLCGKLAVEECGEQFDALVVDEAQDLIRPGVLDVLDAWLKGGLAEGCWVYFGDFHRQAIFGGISGEEMRGLMSAYSMAYAKGRLTLNCRNTRNIGEETALMSGFESMPYRLGKIPGLPVDYHYYDSAEEQAQTIKLAVEPLLRGGVMASDIVIMSNRTLENSGLQGFSGGDLFGIERIGAPQPPRRRAPVIRFATVQEFKGMESPVIILCDVEQVADSAPQSLLYVGMSRARSQLTMLLSNKSKRAIAECVRRKLQQPR